MYVCMYFSRVAYLGHLAGSGWAFASGCQLRVSGQLSWPSAGSMVVLLKEVDCYVWEVVLIGCVIWLAGCHGQC